MAPMHAASSNAAKARPIRLPIDGPPPEPRTSLTAEGRNVVSTGGTGGTTAEADSVWICGSACWHAAARSRSESSSSPGTTRTASGETTRKSCGSSVGFGFSVECIGAPYFVQCHRRQMAGFTHMSCPRLHPGLTKPRRYDGEVEAAGGGSFGELAILAPFVVPADAGTHNPCRLS